MAAGHGHLEPAYVAGVLALVRNSGGGNSGNGSGSDNNHHHNNSEEPPANANDILQRGINELWSRIQADPTAYVMNRDEFQLFNYYRNTFGNSQVARGAVARFWDNFRGEPLDLNGV